MKINPTPFLVITALSIAPILAGCPANKADDAPYGQTAPPTVPAQAPPPALPPGSMEGTTTAPPGPPAMAGGEASSGGAPMMGGGDPMSPLTATPEMDAVIKTAESKTDKKAIAAAYAKRGYAHMTDDNAGQRIKYRAALADFRTALQNDPANVEAMKYKKTIEEIYTSMGRPIPGTEPPGPAK